MICINPMAPDGDVADGMPSLSTCTITRIHCGCIPNRCAAASIWIAHRYTGSPLPAEPGATPRNSRGMAIVLNDKAHEYRRLCRNPGGDDEGYETHDNRLPMARSRPRALLRLGAAALTARDGV